MVPDLGVDFRLGVFFDNVGVVNEAEAFGLGVDFVAGHGNFESVLGVVEAAVHDADGADGNDAKNTDSEHDLNESVASKWGFLSRKKVPTQES